MAAEAADMATANGWSKDLFGDAQDLRPSRNMTFTRRVKFDNEHSLGDELKDVVWLTEEGGFTYASGTGTNHDLNEAVAAESKQTNAAGTEITLVTEVATKLLSSSVKAGKKSFGRYWAKHQANMRQSFAKRVEIAAKYGGSSLGTLASAVDGGTTITMTLTAATFAPAFWAGSKNARIDAYNGATQLNTAAELKITSVNLKTRVITAEGNAADIDAILAVGTNGSGVELYWKGAKGNDGTGARSVANISSTSSAYLGVDPSVYPDYWNATQVDGSGTKPLSWTLIADGLSEAAGRGCEGKLILEVSQKGWSDLAVDINALRHLDASYDKKKTDVGTEGISFRWHTGEVEVVPSNFQKYGEALAYPDPSGDDGADCRRIGSTDVTFMNPDRGGDMFYVTPGKNSVTIRGYSDQQYYTTQVRDHILWHDLLAS